MNPVCGPAMNVPAQVHVHEFATKLIESVDSNPRGVDIVGVVSSQSTYNDAILEMSKTNGYINHRYVFFASNKCYPKRICRKSITFFIAQALSLLKRP